MNDRSGLVNLVLFVGFAAWLLLGAVFGADKDKRHWHRMPDDYRRTEVCVDSTGKVLGYASMRFPSMQPGEWFAEDEYENTLSIYTSKILAKRRVEKEIGGCPGITPVDGSASK